MGASDRCSESSLFAAAAVAFVLLGAVLLGGSVASGQSGLGSQFQVSTNVLEGYQYPGYNDVDIAPNGEFLVVWGNTSIRGQRFDVTGAASGGEFQVNTSTLGIQLAPSVAFDGANRAVVVWENSGDIAAQRYSASGSPIGSELSISADPDAEFKPLAALAPDGAAMFVWSSLGSSGTDSDDTSVQARVYDASWFPIGPRFQVNTTTAGVQVARGLSIAPDGSAVVVWDDFGNGPFGFTLSKGQRYDPSGQRIRSRCFGPHFHARSRPCCRRLLRDRLVAQPRPFEL